MKPSLYFVAVNETIIISMTIHNASAAILTFVSTGKTAQKKKCRPLTRKHSVCAEHQKLADADFSGTRQSQSSAPADTSKYILASSLPEEILISCKLS